MEINYVDPMAGLSADGIIRGAQIWECPHGSDCINKQKCWDAHSKNGLRRYPYKFNKRTGLWEIRYLPMMCRKIRYCNKDDCPLAHSKAEIRFHPWNFRREECKLDREPGQWCGRPFCTFYHNEEERRTSKEDGISFDDADIQVDILYLQTDNVLNSLSYSYV